MNPSPTSSSSRRLWTRVLSGLLAGLAVGLVLIVIGARIWLGLYLHSDGFRKLVSQKTSAALHAEGEYLPLHWTGTTAYSDGFYARGLPGSPLKELRADQIRADLEVSGLFHSAWRVSGLDIQRLQTSIGSVDTAPVAASSAPATASSGRSMRLELEPIRIHDGNIQWAMGGTASGAVRRAQMVFTPGDASWEASASSGELVLLDWQPMRIEQARVRLQRDALFITDSHLQLPDGGKLSASGQIGLGAARESDLTLHFADVPVTPWLPKDWRGRLVGQARGETRLRGRLSGTDALSTEGKVELTGAKLEALPVLNRLAVFTGSEQFRQLQLEKASAEFTWKPTRLAVQKLVMESRGLLRVEGAFTVEKDVIAGEFDVGVSASTLRWLPGARTRVFTVERDGYQWTKVKVQGPTSDIQEDLSTRLITAAGTELFEDTKGTVQKGAETLLGIFHKLTQ